MSLELIDKEVSTEDLDTDNVEKKENQEQSTKEKEKKEATDLEKLEAVLSVLVENKVTSIRNCGGSKVKEKNLLFSRFRSKVDEGENGKSENKSHKTRNNSSTTVTSGCKCGCHHRNHSRCRSLVPCETSGHCHGSQGLSQPPSKPMYPQQSFGSYDHSLFYKADDGLCWERKTDLDHRMDRRKFPVQKCLPKQLSTEQWLNSTTSRQTSTETATTSSGYISPTFGTESKRHRSPLLETIEPNQIRDSVEAGSNGDSETIIDMSKFQAQKSLDAIEESKSKDDILLTEPQQFRAVSELEHLKINNNKSLKSSTFKYNESCHQLLPQCVSTTCLPTCRCPAVGDRSCQNGAPYRHLHPSGGHYMSCYNSPAHSCQ
ncbi:hypothetical protein RUM43_000614 [Polyplax serrata]|uniref:Uncharacterized protein n=1 Tax=Polyplax serrata TaxID=468196 RepID=A0AAN8SGB1_POLSC